MTTSIHSELDRLRATHKSLVLALHDLKRSNQWREDPRFKQGSWEMYLRDNFNMTPHSLDEAFRAYSYFPEVAEKYGPGFVTQVKTKCGAGKVREVVQQIEEAEAKRKTPIPRDKIQDIIKVQQGIQKHTKEKS